MTNDEDKQELFCKGLNPALRYELLTFKFQSFQDLHNQALTLEHGRKDMEVSQKREEGNSRASSSGNKRRVFVPYSDVPRAPYAPKFSGNNSRQPQSNIGGANYHPPAGSHTGVTRYSYGQPGHYSRECSQWVVERNDQQAKKNDKAQGAGHCRLTHVTVEEA